MSSSFERGYGVVVAEVPSYSVNDTWGRRAAWPSAAESA
jgi:hypothetical protein